MHDTHDVRKSQELAKENTEPYYLLHRIKVLESSYNEQVTFIQKLFDSVEELSKRLTDLEEKERARSREDHDRELSVDEIKTWHKYHKEYHKKSFDTEGC